MKYSIDDISHKEFWGAKMASVFSGTQSDFQKWREDRYNAVFTQAQIDETDLLPSRKFQAMFLESGLVGYMETGGDNIVMLKNEVIANMAGSFYNRPVIGRPHSLEITKDNLMNKAKGRVLDVWCENDKWYCSFKIWDTALLEKIDNDGWDSVSCAYIIDANKRQDEPISEYNGIPYNEEIYAGFFHHLCITDKPRYNNSEIVKANCQDFSQINDNPFKNIAFTSIIKFNEVKNNGEEKMVFGFKKEQFAIPADVVFKTNDFGELTVEALVEKCNELSVKCNELEKENCDMKKANEEREEEEKKKKEAEEAEKKENEEKEKAKENELASHQPSQILKDAQIANEKALAERLAKENEKKPDVKNIQTLSEGLANGREKMGS